MPTVEELTANAWLAGYTWNELRNMRYITKLPRNARLKAAMVWGQMDIVLSLSKPYFEGGEQYDIRNTKRNTRKGHDNGKA